MNSYSQTALEVLKNKGYRITKPRRLVVDLLNETKHALSAYEIKDLLSTSGESVDVVSIYRILECLEENNLIHRMLTTGKVRKCQINETDDCGHHQVDHCHHFLICRLCNNIQEVHCQGMDNIAKDVSKEAKFHVESHYLEFIGVCQRCHKAALKH